MVKFISNMLSTMCGMLLALLIITIMFVCIMTPEKTDKGDYTDIYKYWTNNAYLCENFKCK